MRRSLFPLFTLLAFLLLLMPPPALALPKSSIDEYRAHLEKLNALIDSCEKSPQACDANAVGDDEEVTFKGLGTGANVDSFEAHYGWLRDTLKAARDDRGKDRAQQLQLAKRRVDDALVEAQGGGAQTEIAIARQRADAILGHPEFATAQEDSLWQRILARLAQWLDRLFNGVAHFGERSPWIGPVMEWGLIGLALIALAVWAMRALQRQRLAVRVEAAKRMEPWEEAARNWRSLADEEAASGQWRDAVHCLYWASIALLEGRRMWTPNRARTPREYVRLLENGSTRWKLLAQQTQGFERVWYGLRDAGKQDYEHAVELHEGLRAA